MRKIILCLVVLCIISGCKTVTDDSGNETRVVDPNAVAKIESGVDAGAALSQLLAPLIGPSAYLISGGLLTALGIWRKVKPKIMDATSSAEVAHATTTSVVEAIELYKKENPTEWAKLAPKVTEAIQKSGLDPKVVGNVIRGIRGLPPKG